ncbi:MAG TPA: PLP-dependent transferase [Candidatus Thermoplasmatota archaeon]
MTQETARGRRFGTLAVHAGQEPEPVTGAIMTPVFQTSTYVQPAVASPREGRYDYARVANPTREALEANVAALEGGRHGIAFSSGLAAIEAVVKRLSAGDHVVSEENVYGGTMRMFSRVLAKLGLEFTFVDSRDPERIRAAVRPETRVIHVETPTNPMMRLADIRAAAGIAHDAGALLMVDNTFATPFNQRPLQLGADVVVHSTTKYLNGHSDIIGGMVVVDDDTLAEEIHFVRKSSGAVPGPMDAWLCLRGTKTLHVRMRAHNENGLAVARYLEEHPGVDRVLYPGLASHPQHELATRQMSGWSGMVAVDVGTLERARSLAENTRVFQLAESLGGVESLISVPALMTHASVPEAKRREMGVSEGVVRLSVGIEDLADLLEDLEGALAG